MCAGALPRRVCAMPRTRRTVLALAGTALALTGAFAAPAQADSIAFVKNGDVHLATPDGSRTYRVTYTGGYDSVSQADTGRLVAVHGNRIAHLERDGRVISDILTPVSNPGGTQTFMGPYDAQISPDGKKVSYTYYWKYIAPDPACSPTWNCYLNRLYHGTAYTSPDRLTAWDEPGFRRRTGWIHGSWVDNDTELLSDPYMKPNEDLVFDSPGLPAEQGFKRWAEHVQAQQMEDGEMSRNRHKLAYVTGEKNDHVWFYNVRTGDYPAYPSTCNYELKDPAGGRFADLSWSPSANHLAYADGAGVHTVEIPAFGTTNGDCGTPDEDTKLLVAGAKSPDWGPADVPAWRPDPTPPGPGPQPPAPAPAPAPGAGQLSALPAPRGGAKVDERSTAKPSPFTASTTKLATALRKGLTVTLKGGTPGTRKIVARAASTVVASGTAKVAKDGTGKVTLKFTASAKKRLKGKSVVSLSLTGAGLKGTVVLKK